MVNTPPRPPISDWSNDDLLEELCLALRNVGVMDNQLCAPNRSRVEGQIQRVLEIHGELIRRQFEIKPRIDLLSVETSWKMDDLLEDCLLFPGRQPYVKELDGIRRTLRCHLCAKAERPPDARLFWFCQSCMERVALALRQREPFAGVVIFRSYSPESRCTHADSDTPLAAEWHAEGLYGVCERCVLGELARRKEA
jgi:hypothetical protein